MTKGKVYYDQPRDCIDWFREQYEFLSNFYPAKLVFAGICDYGGKRCSEKVRNILASEKGIK